MAKSRQRLKNLPVSLEGGIAMTMRNVTLQFSDILLYMEVQLYGC